MWRELIVNADDFGLSHGVNRGFIECFERGIVTSTSLMVRQPAAAAAGAYARAHPALGVGLHLDFGEWVPKNGDWVPLYTAVPLEDEACVAEELASQLARFEELTSSDPTHIDSHQHVHRNEPLRSLVLAAAERLRVPVRDFSPIIKYCGDFYGQGAEGEPHPEILTVEGLTKIFSGLLEGVTELGCHPGYDDGLATPYRKERGLEVSILCSPEAREVLSTLGITLRRF